ncbi:MAG: type II secretion system protein GspD, partial [Arenimonas sp.]|nr:type II secretion system protein GspD [Arenimonas sp.]
MTRLPSAVPALGLALIVFISGCATVAAPQVRRGDDPLAGTEPARPADTTATTPAASGGPAQANGARLTPGTGQVINQRLASSPAPSLDSTGEATFNFEGESVHAVVKAILGDMLGQNYVIAPGVQGTVTLATPKPVSPA